MTVSQSLGAISDRDHKRLRLGSIELRYEMHLTGRCAYNDLHLCIALSWIVRGDYCRDMMRVSRTDPHIDSLTISARRTS